MDIHHAGSPHQVARFDAFPLVAVTPSVPAGRQRYTALRAQGPLVAPSLLLCDFAHLADEVHKLEDADAKLLHLDVMDGHFVPNLTYGVPIAEAVRRTTGLPIEAHLMVSDPDRYVEPFVAAGCDALIIHAEAVPDPRPVLRKIRALGAAAGLAYNPNTSLAAIRDYLDDCDAVLTMSVMPGFGGQAFQAVALENLKQLSALVGPQVLLEVDGGVNESTIAACTEAGAQLCVVGSAIFKHPDYSQAVATLTRLAHSRSRPR